VIASAYYGDAILYNAGEVTADSLAEFDGSAAGSAYALGVLLHGDYVVELYNTGTVSAYASADHGTALARGFVGTHQVRHRVAGERRRHRRRRQRRGGLRDRADRADLQQVRRDRFERGGIEAYAHADGGVASATALLVQAPGAHGYFYGAIGASLYNYGDILALADAEDGTAVAVGARVEGAQDAGAFTYNAGQVEAAASGAYAYATGLQTWSYTAMSRWKTWARSARSRTAAPRATPTPRAASRAPKASARPAIRPAWPVPTTAD
jgi:hypothetical protein